MKIIKPSAVIETKIDGAEMLKAIERAGRTCYKSEDRITADSAEKFIHMLVSKGHESVIEHQSVTVRFIVDRGVSHELVRHRLASFSQESTRYCNYGKSGEVTFIEPLLEDLGMIDLTGIHWVIVGGESGPKARPMESQWVASIKSQCDSQGVPFFFKQWGGRRDKGGCLIDGIEIKQWPSRTE